jgi:hypothetical protein
MLGIMNFPEVSLVVLRSNPLTGLLIVTVALGTSASVGSWTVPLTEVELPD